MARALRALVVVKVVYTKRIDELPWVRPSPTVEFPASKEKGEHSNEVNETEETAPSSCPMAATEANCACVGTPKGSIVL